MKGISVISLFYFLSSFSSSGDLDLSGFCQYINKTEIDSATLNLLNVYLRSKDTLQASPNNYESKFIVLDSLISDFERLGCIDSCSYGVNGRNSILKSYPPMKDIYIYKGDSTGFILRIVLSSPLRVKFLSRLEL